MGGRDAAWGAWLSSVAASAARGGTMGEAGSWCTTVAIGLRHRSRERGKRRRRAPTGGVLVAAIKGNREDAGSRLGWLGLLWRAGDGLHGEVRLQSGSCGIG
jgi:hypothetical protein